MQKKRMIAMARIIKTMLPSGGLYTPELSEFVFTSR